MRIAILSDIHGNMPALEAVFEDINQNNVDKTICMGDMVNYGPESEAVVQEIIKREIPSILGNHELGLLNTAISRFSKTATLSLSLTRKQMSAKSMDFIKTLPQFIKIDDLHFVHGCPPNFVWEYIFHQNSKALKRAFASIKRVAFVGHTHYMDIYSQDKFGNTDRDFLGEGFFTLTPGNKYIFNIGSVGQPRDNDKNAKYAIFDTETDTLIMRFVEYDIQKTCRMIYDKGFPVENATRLQP